MKATSDVSIVVIGEFEGIDIPLPLGDPDACHHGVKCPVAASAVNTFNETIYIDPSFPTVSLWSSFYTDISWYDTELILRAFIEVHLMILI